LLAALKILADVAIYRIRRREMANLAAAFTVMVALRLPLDEVLVRLGFGVLLNLLAYLTNDYYDVEADLASPDKDEAKARYLKEHMRAALGLQIVLALLLAAVGAAWSPGLVVALVAGAGTCWLYSARLKHVPVADVLAMMVWGVAMPLVAFPLDSLLGWALVAQLGLFSACFETIQVIRDHDEDVKSGTRTTAVLLGIGKALMLERLLMVMSAVYAVLVINRWVGLALFVAPFIPLGRDDTSTYWNRVRLVQGLAWLAMVGWVAWSGATTGAVVSVERGQVVGWLSFFG
jgi:4-hydroxybenzoate polyprenyltransferase